MVIVFVLSGAVAAYAVASGSLLWVQKTSHRGRDGVRKSVVDTHGNVYTTGSTDLTYYWGDNDITLTKYGPGGGQKWQRTWKGRNYDWPYDIAIDQNNNVYIVGRSAPSLYEREQKIVVIKYNSMGQRQWVRRHSGRANDMTLDRDGNIYVTGYVGYAPNHDLILLRYRSNGKLMWTRRYDGPASRNDEGESVYTRGRGWVVVTGFVRDRRGWSNWVTIRYDRGGNRRWLKRYNGIEDGYDFAARVVVDASGNSYVTGSSSRAAVTKSYDRDGNVRWSRRIGGSDLGASVADMALDTNDNLVILGWYYPSEEHISFVMKYSSSGRFRWRKRYRGEHHVNNYPKWGNTVAIGKNNSVLVVANDADKSAIIKYSGGGTRRWMRNNSDSEYAFGIAVDNRRGSAYVTGENNIGLGRGETLTSKYKQ